MKLSILIPHLNSYGNYLERLQDVLYPQCLEGQTELVLWGDEGEATIGTKRNWLMEKAKGEYVCFIDSDDMVSPNYVALLMEGIEKGVDCCSLKGEYTVDGKNPELFEHSIKYRAYKTNPAGSTIRFERFPNHLNCIRANIAKGFLFPEKDFGEDTAWATKIFKSGLIKTEHYIPEVIYYYLYRSKK